jgi:hypothetical protein
MPAPRPWSPTAPLIAASLALAALLAGCGEDGTRVPGTVRPGSIEAVTAEIAGGGDGPGPLAGIGVTPLTGAIPPTLPLITPPQAILFYVFPRVSGDGLAWRNGVWIARIIKPFGWGVQDAMDHDALHLSALTDLAVDAQGQLQVSQQHELEPGPAAIAGLRGMAEQLPWRPGSAQPTTRTTVIYPASGQAVSTTAPGTGAAYLQPNGAVNLQEVQHAMLEAQARLREAQAQKAAGGGAGGATPTPGEPPGATPVGAVP